MYIGQLSKLTGVSRKAILLYESMGLIPTPTRQGSYRIYGERDVGIIRTIKRAQSLGFQLKELLGVIPGEMIGTQLSAAQLADLIEEKRRSLHKQIAEAREKDRLLLALRESLLSESGCWCDKSG
jgi:DNA-binding transcriptional MerR regulator